MKTKKAYLIFVGETPTNQPGSKQKLILVLDEEKRYSVTTNPEDGRFYLMINSGALLKWFQNQEIKPSTNFSNTMNLLVNKFLETLDRKDEEEINSSSNELWRLLKKE